jgi:hypothetical protein
MQFQEKTNFPTLLIIIIIWVVLLIGGVILKPYLGILGEREDIFSRKPVLYQRNYIEESNRKINDNNSGAPNNIENNIENNLNKPVSCSYVADGVCPANCSFISDADCCVDAGRYWLQTPWGYYSCYIYYDSRCEPKQYRYCSNLSDNCCPSWCSAGADVDCCLKDGREWIQGKGCY